MRKEIGKGKMNKTFKREEEERKRSKRRGKKRCQNIKNFIYNYIYIFFKEKKSKTGYFRIINLFPSCFVFLM